MFIVQVPGTISDTSLPQPGVADPLLVGANGGIKTLFDLAASSSWAKQAAPVNNDAVLDLSGNGNLAVVVAGTAPTFGGGGFDFTTETALGNVVVAPVGPLASIKAATNQYFIVCGYFKLPAAADWANGSGINPFFLSTSSAFGYSTPEPDLVTIAQLGAPGVRNGLTARRQTNGGTGLDAVSFSDAQMTSHYGKLAQLAFWRNAAGQALSITTSAGTLVATAAVGSNNSGDFSAKSPRWGRPIGFNVTAAFNKYKLYRGWIEDLSISGRDPATVLAADYAAVVSRFS